MSHLREEKKMNNELLLKPRIIPDLEKEKIRLSKDNYKRKVNLPKTLQKLYDTLMDNGIEVSDCYWEYEDEFRKSDGGQWWFELGGTIDNYSWNGGDVPCGTITGNITTIASYIKGWDIFLDQDETEKNYNPFTKEINDK